MKPLLLCFVFCLFTSASFSQKIRFTDKTNIWYIADTDPFSPPALRKTSIVTVSNMGYSLREDTALGQVWYKPWGDTAERILYDYHLQIGDSITYHYAAHDSLTYFVTAKDSILINGVYHGVQRFSPRGVVIEGLGARTGPGPFPKVRPDMWGVFCCFSNNGARPTIPYNHHFIQNCALSVRQDDLTTNTFAIQSPLRADSKIVFPEYFYCGKFQVTDISGHLILNHKIEKDGINPGSFLNVAGMYFYTITDNRNGKTFSGKFVFMQ